MEKEPINKMEVFITFLFSYFLIPLISLTAGYIAGLIICDQLNLRGVAESLLLSFIVLIISLLLFWLFRKLALPRYSFNINAFLALFMSLLFLILMIFSTGAFFGIYAIIYVIFNSTSLIPFILENLQGTCYNIPIMTISVFVAGCISSLYLHRNKRNTTIFIGAFVVIALVAALDVKIYNNRPEIRYGGHGFDYMHGFSSTDFTDYMVYSKDSKLASLDHPASFMIENESDMPVMDGAEACYPLYAAVAKALYKDIDIIERNNVDQFSKTNGKYVSFTNTIYAFRRLICFDRGYERTDMVFGARPSAAQLEEAKEESIDLNITVIGKEAFVFFVKEDNPVDNLTSEQVKQIYHGDITNWKELGGKNERIVAFQRPENSGSQTMMQYFMGELSLKSPETYEVQNAMTGVVHEIAEYSSEDGAMGYSFRYFIEGLCQEENVKILSIDGVYPSLDKIESKEYPLTVDLCLITRENDPNPYVKKIIDFMLSDDGQYLVRQTGYGRLKVYD